MGLDIEINSKQYSLVPSGDGTKVSTRPVQQFVQSIKDTGRTRPEDVSPYETFIHPDLTGGFGRYRINSDKAFDPSEYRRFWDSTLDTIGGKMLYTYQFLQKMRPNQLVKQIQQNSMYLKHQHQ